jgi:lipopolysaccharide/colanic/teichoic acid biosynthesis glycosyltransferase
MGRNNLSWEEKFAYDIQYVDNISLIMDIKVIVKTVVKVLKREGIGQGEKQPVSLHIERADWVKKDN